MKYLSDQLIKENWNGSQYFQDDKRFKYNGIKYFLSEKYHFIIKRLLVIEMK